MKNRKDLFYRKLEGGSLYHVYNQTNNSETLFRHWGDYVKFIDSLKRFVLPFVNVLAMNLLRNHFHLIIEVLEKNDLYNRLSREEFSELSPGCMKLVLDDKDNMPEIMSNRFGSLFKSYAEYFNHKYHRRGNLFYHRFSRKLIDSNEYAKHAIYYVNANAIRHEVSMDILDYDWTSFHDVVSEDESILNLERLYKEFGSRKACLEYHKHPVECVDEHKFVIEEDDIFETRRSNTYTLDALEP